MKNIKFLLGLLVVAVAMASCATTQNTPYDDELNTANARTQQIGDRLYIQDPYQGTVILERDPFTGRYYDVTYGYNRLGSPYYYRGYSSRPYSGYYRNHGYSGRSIQQVPSHQEVQKNKEGARKSILGN